MCCKHRVILPESLYQASAPGERFDRLKSSHWNVTSNLRMGIQNIGQQATGTHVHVTYCTTHRFIQTLSTGTNKCIQTHPSQNDSYLRTESKEKITKETQPTNRQKMQKMSMKETWVSWCQAAWSCPVSGIHYSHNRRTYDIPKWSKMIQNVHHPFPTNQQCRAFIHWRICFSSFVSSSPSFTANSSAADKTCLGQEWKQKANTITKNRAIYLGLFVQKSRCQQNITTDDWCLAKKKMGLPGTTSPHPSPQRPSSFQCPCFPSQVVGRLFLTIPDSIEDLYDLSWHIILITPKWTRCPVYAKLCNDFQQKNKSTISWTTGDRNITAPQYRISFLCFFIQNISIDQVDSQNPHTRSIWKRHQLANNSLQNMCTISISCSSWWLTDDSI